MTGRPQWTTSSPGMNADLLASAAWECASAPPGEVVDSAALGHFTGRWVSAGVPGTAAAAIRSADGVQAALAVDYDGSDWWFRTSFEVTQPGPWSLTFAGLATLADVWLNGELLLHSENMFRVNRIELDRLQPRNELAIRFAALTPELRRRRPRPRWRASLVREQNLRWFRTTLLGRMPGWAGQAAPVGPWRPISLRAATPTAADVVRCALTAAVAGTQGVLDAKLTLRLPDGVAGTRGVLRVGDVEQPIVMQSEVRCQVTISEVALWWPHTHGDPARYRVSLQ